MTPTQFSNLEASLQAAPGVKLVLTTPDQGTLTTPDVTLAAFYDGTAVLTLTVTAKHSLAADVAPEHVLEAHITAKLAPYLVG